MPKSVLVQVVRLSISFEKEVHERVTDLADAHDVSTAWTKGRWKVGMSNTKLKMRGTMSSGALGSDQRIGAAIFPGDGSRGS